MPLPRARSALSRRVASIALFCLVPIGYVGAEEPSTTEAHRHEHGGHAAMRLDAPIPLSEAGQSSFAALAETVAALTVWRQLSWPV